jgi:NhaP-type Na+/H+ or K+/H+ antiporter
MLGLGIFAAAFTIHGLLAARADRASISRPMVFTAVGALVAITGVVDPAPGGEDAALLLALAEVALALVLFADASRVNLRRLRRGAETPIRLLSLGMLLSIGLGTVVGVLLLEGLDAWECAALAAILAPTDAALGAAVVDNERVPRFIRQTLNVEAGLNDGLAVPFLLMFIAGATVSEGFEPGSFLASTALEKIGIGVLAGALAGLIGGRLVRRARAANWSTGTSEQLAMAGLAVALFALTEELGGSGFIAAFVGGLLAGPRIESDRRRALGFVDEEGAMVAAFVFFALGLSAVELFDALTWQIWVYALLSLTLIRMLPVALALLGSGLRLPTTAFIGWFGPRGLASVVLALIVLEQETQLQNVDTLVLTTLLTVILSVVGHGFSAGPLSRRYAGWAESLPPDAAERGEAAEVPTRSGRDSPGP